MKFSKVLFWIKIFFKTFCICLALGFILKLVLKFMKDEDKPVMSFKKFNQSPIDKYPSYTICFEGQDKSLDMDEDQGRIFKRSNGTYEHYVKGNIDDSSLGRNKFEEETKGVKELLFRYRISTTDDRTTNYINCNQDKILTHNHKNGRQVRVCPFYRSYQDASRVCLTRKNIYSPGRTYLSEAVDLVREPREEGKDLDRNITKYSLYIHHPEQRMRHFFQRFDAKKVFQADSMTMRNYIKIMLSGISLLRNRLKTGLDGQESCYPHATDDQRIYEALFKQLNKSSCVPPYWKKFVPEGMSVKECSSSEELRRLHQLLMYKDASGLSQEIDRENIIDSLSMPCETMSFGMTMERPPNGYYKKVFKQSAIAANKNLACNRQKDGTVQPCFMIEFTYLNERYQEIKNEQDFDFAMLGAEVGGFVGFILGYSLLEFLENMSQNNKFWNKMKLF